MLDVQNCLLELKQKTFNSNITTYVVRENGRGCISIIRLPQPGHPIIWSLWKNQNIQDRNTCWVHEMARWAVETTLMESASLSTLLPTGQMFGH